MALRGHVRKCARQSGVIWTPSSCTKTGHMPAPFRVTTSIEKAFMELTRFLHSVPRPGSMKGNGKGIIFMIERRDRRFPTSFVQFRDFLAPTLALPLPCALLKAGTKGHAKLPSKFKAKTQGTGSTASIGSCRNTAAESTRAGGPSRPPGAAFWTLQGLWRV